MNFDALEVSLQLIQALRAPVTKLQQHDRAETAQLTNAANSIAHNVSEGRRRVGKDRVHLFRIGAGSADEVRTALRVAIAWGWLEQDDVSEALALVDRVLAMLWKLTH